jgi:hypothetical protein
MSWNSHCKKNMEKGNGIGAWYVLNTIVLGYSIYIYKCIYFLEGGASNFQYTFSSLYY